MSTPRILLIQARAANDPAADHERSCVAQRIGIGNATLTTRSAVSEQASPAWLDGQDAIIIGGSGAFSVHHPESDPWVSKLRTLVDAALSANLPGFGICFGHQLIGRHFGAEVHTDRRYAEVGTIDVDLTPAGRADPLFSSVDPSLPVHTGHSDHVDATPEGLELMASAPSLETQAFRVRGTCFYSTQFHPDLTGAEAVARYMAFAQNKPDALANASRFRPGADTSVTLLARFVELLDG